MKLHVDELAELYALGSLEAVERTAVERHIRGCTECADRIRTAEDTVAFISDLETHHEPPQTIAENFSARLAQSRQAQKRLSLKVISSVLVGGLIVIGLVH